MKKFIRELFKSILVAVTLAILIYSVSFFSNSIIINENNFYDKFNSIHKKSIIIGTSRARYAFDLAELDSASNFKNFSFSVDMSSFDKSFINYLKLAINQDSCQPNITIITLDPYSLSNIKKPSYFSKFNFKPKNFNFINFEYIIKERITPITIIEENLKLIARKMVYGNNFEKDNRVINFNVINSEINKYGPPDKINPEAIENLESLILNFKLTSEVFLVRLPITSEFYNFENLNSPEFENLMLSISNELDVKFFDLNTDKKLVSKLKFYDIHHLNKRSSKVLTKYVDSIIKL